MANKYDPILGEYRQDDSVATVAFYIGDPDTDGSWRIIISGDNLNTEKREGGVWVVKAETMP